MTVKELIEKLSELDPELHVFVHGYEGGYAKVKDISEEQEFALNVHAEWYYGPHELTRNGTFVPDKSEYEIVKGIVL